MGTIDCKRREKFNPKDCAGCQAFRICQSQSDSIISCTVTSEHQRGKFCSGWRGSQCKSCQYMKFLLRTMRHFGGGVCGNRCEACHSIKSLPPTLNPKIRQFEYWWTVNMYTPKGSNVPRYMRMIYIALLSKKKYIKKF